MYTTHDAQRTLSNAIATLRDVAGGTILPSREVINLCTQLQAIYEHLRDLQATIPNELPQTLPPGHPTWRVMRGFPASPR